MVKEEELKALKLTFEVTPCMCRAFKGPHHHLGEYTIIPWEDFVRGLQSLEDASAGVSDGTPGTVRRIKCTGAKVC